jgi:CBS domain-containing protein
MNIRDIMTTRVTTASPDTTLEEIATMMKRENVGAIPIVDEEDLCGLLTDRDIVLRCVAEGRSPAETRAEDILSEDLHVIEVDDDVDSAAELMSRQQIRRLPVVENGRLVGILSIGDIAVKEGDDRTSGDTLQGISQGVKSSASSGRKTAASRSGKVRTEQKASAKHAAAGKRSQKKRVIPIRADSRSSRKSAGRKKAG